MPFPLIGRRISRPRNIFRQRILIPVPRRADARLADDRCSHFLVLAFVFGILYHIFLAMRL